MKLSARNRLKGKVVSVDEGLVTAKIVIDVESPIIIDAVITKESVKEMVLKPGDTVEAIIKSTEIIVGKD